MEERGGASLRVYSAAAATTLLVITALPALLEPRKFLQDDSYFYLQIAHNVAAGLGSTFNGITPTNGYHPLWMIIAVAAAMLANGDKAVLLHVTVAIQILLAAGVAVLFLRLTRAMGLAYPVAGIALALTYLLGTGVYGCEAHLNALTLTAAMLSLWHALDSERPLPWVLTGALLGLAVLARLDNVFAVAALGALAALHGRTGGLATISRRTMLLGLSGTAFLAPYLAANWMQYGHLMPISGAIKSTFPSFDFDLRRLGAMGRLTAPFGLVALLIGLFLDRDPRRRVLWCGLGIGVIAQAVYVAGFTKHYTFWAWYYVSGVLAAGLSIAYLPGWLGTRFDSRAARAIVGPLVIASTLVVLTAGAARAWLKAYNPIQAGPIRIDLPVNEYRWPEEFAAWLKQHLPPGSAIFVYDWPGALAYYSDLRILPMDGLVNDFRYNDELLARGAIGYLCAHHVGYFFGLIDDDRVTRQVEVPAPLYRRTAGTLSLRADQLVVRIRDAVSRPDEALPFAVWRLDCAGESGEH